jgi:hypothetical protein
MTRIDEALAVVAGCVGPKGFYASTGTYAHQYWTRDLSFCAETLLSLGYTNVVRRHLVEIWARSAPALFMDRPWSWFRQNTSRAQEMLNPRAWRAVHNALVATVDSPLHAALATRVFEETTGKQIPGAKRRRFPTAIRGGDWRDLAVELHRAYTLSNQCLLHRLRGPGHTEACSEMRWPSRDPLGVDSLGQALAILWDTCCPRRSLSEWLDPILGPVGIRCGSVAKRPPVPSCNQYATVWPFVSYHVILALRKLGERDLAEREFAKLERLPGFYEWYDPVTGAPNGSPGQLWSACLYLRAAGYVRPP